jgi:hypothetical protein
VNLGNWQLDTIFGGALLMDGGVMFGVVPKMLWQKVVPADDANRLKYCVNCVLARDGRHTILIDAGYGVKYDPLDRRFSACRPAIPCWKTSPRSAYRPKTLTRLC